jgi:hypothetical protein
MSKFLNNLCEDLVNGSNPRYAGSQPSISEQVAWQLKKEEENRQALFAESMKKFEEQMHRPAPTYTPNYSAPTAYSSTYTASYSPTTSSYTPHLSHLSNLSSSYPSYSPNSSSYSSTYPSFSCTFSTFK